MKYLKVKNFPRLHVKLRQQTSLACIPCMCRFRHVHVKNKGKKMFKN